VKILYLTDAQPDYLSDDLLYGLRTLLGREVVDYPRKDVLYRMSSVKSMANRLYGRGFHCFGLDDLPIDRTDILAKVSTGYFDLIVNSSGWRIRCPLHPQLIVIDGEDHGKLMPRYAGKVPLYFKRELFAPRPGVEPILFALPDFLYDNSVLSRTKRYHASFLPTSEIRERLAATFPPQYSFETWGEYLADIKQSWFAISPKGAGYDCQRHYEILGHAVLCIFMDERTPRLLRECFVDNHNCLTFTTPEELVTKMDHCAEPQRLIEQARADLVARHLASKRAEEVLATIARRGVPRRKMSWVSRLEWRYWIHRKVSRHAARLACIGALLSASAIAL
jgi:hypothetical protein